MKEDLIIEWFQSWFDSHWNNFEVIFESDAYYSESWGPEYKGIIEIKKWFNDWHEHFKLDKWEIKQFIHTNKHSIVEWHFSCIDLDGVHEFDGISLIEWSPNSLIKSTVAQHLLYLLCPSYRFFILGMDIKFFPAIHCYN